MNNPSPTFIGSLEYNLTPFASAGIEFQKGTISAGDSINELHRRFFKNDYMSFSANARVQLGQFVDFESSNFLYAIRGAYAGMGLGYMRNSMKEIVRKQSASGYVFPGADKGSEIFIPINTGINFNILDRWGYTKFIFNVNYQMNVTFGETVDGYNDDPAKFKNRFRDFYGVASVGIRYCFGPEGLY
jgi:hypothetical protein